MERFQKRRVMMTTKQQMTKERIFFSPSLEVARSIADSDAASAIVAAQYRFSASMRSLENAFDARASDIRAAFLKEVSQYVESVRMKKTTLTQKPLSYEAAVKYFSKFAKNDPLDRPPSRRWHYRRRGLTGNAGGVLRSVERGLAWGAGREIAHSLVHGR
jgi:hypothetical protein